ncbi:MAG: T9SS type A sorting domain-containing protein [Balneola sp.]
MSLLKNIGMECNHSEQVCWIVNGGSSEEFVRSLTWKKRIVQILRKYTQDEFLKKQFILSLFLVVFSGSIQAQNITEMEYFFNTDPGVGAATSISSFTNDTEITFTGDVETSILDNGIHTFFLRAKNSDEEWGLPIKKLVLVDAGEVIEIDELEYFFNADPGVGMGTTLSVTTSTEIDVTTDLETSSLSEGIHTLFIRAKASGGGWGLPVKKLVLVDKDDPNIVSIITEAEYFFDVDPGFGNGNSIDLTDGSEIDEVISLNTTELSEGMYTAYIRVKDEDGEWSLIAKQEIEVVDPLITIAEARTLDNGTEVTVKGVITRTSGNFVYLQEEQAALMIFANETSSPNFFSSLQNDSLNAGDSLLVTGSLFEFEGLKEIIDVTEFSVLNSGNPLPESQEISLTEAINNAENYESEIVLIRDLEFIDGASGTFTLGTRYTVQKAGTDTTYRFFVHGPGNSDIAGEPIPQTIFDYEGIIKEINDGEGGTHHVLAAHNPTDITNVAEPVFPTIAEIREMPLGEIVTVKALVTRAKGRFAYIQQDSAAVNMFNPDGIFFDAVVDGSVKSGDSLIVTGEVSEFEGLRQLNSVSEFEVLSSGNELPEPVFLTMDELVSSGYKYQAELVKLDSLFITESSTFNFGFGYKIFQKNSSSSAQLYIPNSGDTEVEEGLIPALFNYEGILGQFDPEGTGSGHQLRPINEVDIIEIEPAADILEITFRVDMSVQVDKDKFNPDSMTAQLAGSFTGWSSTVDMQNLGDHRYDITQDFIDPIPGDTLFYKFVYTKNDSIIFEDPNPEISPVATEFHNRFYVFSGNEMDTNEDGIKDVVLDRVFFSDDDGSVPIDSLISLSIEPVNAFITDTIEIPIQITGLEDLPMSSFELAINFDPALIDLELSDNPESLTSDFLVESNKIIPGKIVVSGASTSSISSDGDLLFLNVYPQSSGTGSIDVERLTLNEDGELVNPSQSLITIIERVCGDVTDDRTVSTLDATFVLRHTVFLSPQYPLTGLDSVAADVTGNGDISAFDASRILQFEVGFIDELGCNSVATKKEPLITKALWHKVEKEDEVLVTIDVSNNDFDIYSAQLDMKIEEGLSFSRINNKPTNWQTLVNTKEGSTLVSMFGVQPLESKSLEFVLTKDQRSLKAIVNANVTLNESELYKLNELIVNTLPDEFSLKQNYPNPFNPSTNIEYSLPEQTNVTLTIYNMLGQKVATLVNETLAAGTYSQTWDASSVSSGVYFYRLKAGSKIFTKRMLLVK